MEVTNRKTMRIIIGVVIFLLIILNSFGIKYRITGSTIQEPTKEIARNELMIVEAVLENRSSYGADFYNQRLREIKKFIAKEPLTKWEVEITLALQEIYIEFIVMDTEDPASVHDTKERVEVIVSEIRSKIE